MLTLNLLFNFINIFIIIVLGINNNNFNYPLFNSYNLSWDKVYFFSGFIIKGNLFDLENNTFEKV